MSLHFGARHPFCLHLTAHGSCLHGEDDDRLAGKCNVHQPSSTFQTQQLWIIPARSSQNIEMYWDIFILLLHVNADSTFIASPFNLFSWSWWLSADSCSEVEINPPPRNPENISLRISQDPWGILRWPLAPLAKLPPLLRSYASASSAAHEVRRFLSSSWFFYPRCWIVLDVQITSINIDNILYPTSSDKCSIVDRIGQLDTTWEHWGELKSL